MLPNEIFALACRAWYEEQGLIVDERNGEFAHSPLTKRECDTGYYLLHGHHQHQGLLQSKDLDKCCFFSGDTKRWLLECDYFPENFFELWDIYEKYSSEQCRKIAETGRKNGTGFFDPEVRKKALEAANEALKKTIIVTFLDGSKQPFKSIKEAAGFLGVTPMAVSQRLKKGPCSKKSKLATYGFELA